MASIRWRLALNGGLLSLGCAAISGCMGDDTSATGSGGGAGATDASLTDTADGGVTEAGDAATESDAAATAPDAGDAPAPSNDSTAAAAGLNKVNHIVVIYLENWSFDSLYGEFPGAEGLSSAAAMHAPPQLDRDGVIYSTLPQVEPVLGGGSDGGALGPDGAALLFPNAPFALDPYLAPNAKTVHDLVHRFYQEQMQINGGLLNNFVSVSDAQGMVMGYFHTSDLPLAALAADYTLCDHFFHAAFGGSFLNHQWLVAAASPVFQDAPASVRAQLAIDDAAAGDGTALLARDPVTGLAIGDGFVTPDGYVINTSYSVNTPHPPTVATAQLVPNQTLPTIGDRLSDNNIDWAWYAGGWNDAVTYTNLAAEAGLDAAALSEAGVATAAGVFQYHHQPFVYYAKYADGTAAKAAHLKDEADFVAAVQAGTLPAVSFVKPVGINNEHPNYADVLTGENHVTDLVAAIRGNAALWSSTAIIITYDENGGFWDHVPPPVIDKWGPGTRVPAIIISPYARKHYVDNGQYDTTSILALIERRFGLQPLGSRDRMYLTNGHDLTSAFDFAQTP